MLLRTMRFGALRVEDVMVPRADIIAVDENEPILELLKTFDAAGVSRVPLFRETLDDPRGMVHVKDLLRWLMGDALGRPASAGHVPASRRFARARRMQAARTPARPHRASTSQSRSSRPSCAARDLRAAVHAGREPADSHAVDAHSHGACRRRIRRHRRACHHRRPRRADRRRHRGRARRGRGRQHHEDPKLGLVDRSAHAGAASWRATSASSC